MEKSKYKIFIIPYSQKQGKFDDVEFQNFVNSHNIADVDKKFFYHDCPCWTVFVTYLTEEYFPDNIHVDKKIKIELNQEEKQLYEKLRKWRNERAKQEEVSPFILFSNDHLTKIAKEKPDSLEKLSKIYGVGKKKSDKYGDAVLKIIREESKNKSLKKEQQ